MVNKLVENTIRISLLIQIVTTIISADGFISSVSPEHAILKEILYIETIVQVIEGIFYSHIISGLNDIKSMTPRRYFDWLITTPIMLFSTVLFFKYSELKEANSLKEFTSKDFYEGNKEILKKKRKEKNKNKRTQKDFKNINDLMNEDFNKYVSIRKI
jgi:ribosomal protein S21